MDNFVVSANLPEKAACVIIGEKYLPMLQESLHRIGIDIITVPANPMVDKRLSSHADLSLFHAGGNNIFLAECHNNSVFSEKLAEHGLKVLICDKKQGDIYPNDANLNICSVGNRFIFNPSVSSPKAISFLEGQGRSPVSCRQGYCKCSVSVVDDSSIICADKGIARACREQGLDVLEIQPGYVELEGFGYGFIGGASFKVSRDEIAFTGTLDSHPDKEKILYFLENHGVKPIILTNLPLFDIGSAIPIFEKQPKT